jgi:alkylation response protein AidB-like acyl-CoA dehydrogenase
LILSTIHAFRSAREIAESIFDTFGTTALYAKCPLERIYRDAITVNQHVLLNDMQVETVGAAMFGEAPPTNRML